MAINPLFVKPSFLAPPAGGKTSSVQAAKNLLAGIDWSGGAPAGLRKLDAAGTNAERMKQVARLPKAVREAFDFYYKHVEGEDWGSVSVYKLDVKGQAFYAVRTGTDGDDGYLELFNYAGKRVATGLQGWGTDGKPTTSWDSRLGAVRAKTEY